LGAEAKKQTDMERAASAANNANAGDSTVTGPDDSTMNADETAMRSENTNIEASNPAAKHREMATDPPDTAVTAENMDKGPPDAPHASNANSISNQVGMFSFANPPTRSPVQSFGAFGRTAPNATAAALGNATPLRQPYTPATTSNEDTQASSGPAALGKGSSSVAGSSIKAKREHEDSSVDGSGNVNKRARKDGEKYEAVLNCSELQEGPDVEERVYKSNYGTFKVRYNKTTDVEKLAFWNSFQGRINQTRETMSDEVFGSDFTTEELNLLDLRAAADLMPNLVNSNGDIRTRTAKAEKPEKDLVTRLKNKAKFFGEVSAAAKKQEQKYIDAIAKTDKKLRKELDEIPSTLGTVLRATAPIQSFAEFEKRSFIIGNYVAELAERFRRELLPAIIFIRREAAVVAEREQQLLQLYDYQSRAISNQDVAARIYFVPKFIEFLAPEAHLCECDKKTENLPDQPIMEDEDETDTINPRYQNHTIGMTDEGLALREDQPRQYLDLLEYYRKPSFSFAQWDEHLTAFNRDTHTLREREEKKYEAQRQVEQTAEDERMARIRVVQDPMNLGAQFTEAQGSLTPATTIPIQAPIPLTDPAAQDWATYRIERLERRGRDEYSPEPQQTQVRTPTPPPQLNRSQGQIHHWTNTEWPHNLARGIIGGRDVPENPPEYVPRSQGRRIHTVRPRQLPQGDSHYAPIQEERQEADDMDFYNPPTPPTPAPAYDPNSRAAPPYLENPVFLQRQYDNERQRQQAQILRHHQHSHLRPSQRPSSRHQTLYDDDPYVYDHHQNQALRSPRVEEERHPQRDHRRHLQR